MTNEQHNTINHPNHYTQGQLEVIDIMADKMTYEEFKGYLQGNVWKYMFRWQHKNGTEDLKKAQWYNQRLIDHVNNHAEDERLKKLLTFNGDAPND